MLDVLITIQPYWVFLIIAKKMGWKVEREKTVEVRKDFPTQPNWSKKVLIYCGQNKASFNRIPKEYQPVMATLLGKVVGLFTVDGIDTYLYTVKNLERLELSGSCLTFGELFFYSDGKTLYGWQISNLKVYAGTKELSELKKVGYKSKDRWLMDLYPNTHCHYEAWVKKFEIKKPPQSWCYVQTS